MLYFIYKMLTLLLVVLSVTCVGALVYFTVVKKDIDVSKEPEKKEEDQSDNDWSDF